MYNKLLWDPSVDYFRNMPEEVISREKLSFLVHEKEVSFGKAHVPSY